MPAKYRDQLGTGKILVTNWHALRAQERARRRRHDATASSRRARRRPTPSRRTASASWPPACRSWSSTTRATTAGGRTRPARPRRRSQDLTTEETRAPQGRQEEARVWLAGLDRINNCGLLGKDDDGRRSLASRVHRPLGHAVLPGEQRLPGRQPLPLARQRLRPRRRHRMRHRQDPAAACGRRHGEEGRGRPARPEVLPAVAEHHRQPAAARTDRPSGRSPRRSTCTPRARCKTLAAQWKKRFDQIDKRQPTADTSSRP